MDIQFYNCEIHCAKCSMNDDFLFDIDNPIHEKIFSIGDVNMIDVYKYLLTIKSKLALYDCNQIFIIYTDKYKNKHKISAHQYIELYNKHNINQESIHNKNQSDNIMTTEMNNTIEQPICDNKQNYNLLSMLNTITSQNEQPIKSNIPNKYNPFINIIKNDISTPPNINTNKTSNDKLFNENKLHKTTTNISADDNDDEDDNKFPINIQEYINSILYDDKYNISIAKEDDKKYLEKQSCEQHNNQAIEQTNKKDIKQEANESNSQNNTISDFSDLLYYLLKNNDNMCKQESTQCANENKCEKELKQHINKSANAAKSNKCDISKIFLDSIDDDMKQNVSSPNSEDESNYFEFINDILQSIFNRIRQNKQQCQTCETQKTSTYKPIYNTKRFSPYNHYKQRYHNNCDISNSHKINRMRELYEINKQNNTNNLYNYIIYSNPDNVFNYVPRAQHILRNSYYNRNPYYKMYYYK